MSSGLNKVQLIGNLGADADLKYAPGGDAVATISIATTEYWKGQDGQKKERTEWHRVVIWAKMAESLAEYLVKGKQVYVEGRLQTRKWQDKQGQDRWTTEIRADKVMLLGGPGSGKGGGVPHPAETGTASDGPPVNVNDQDIPF